MNMHDCDEILNINVHLDPRKELDLQIMQVLLDHKEIIDRYKVIDATLSIQLTFMRKPNEKNI